MVSERRSKAGFFLPPIHGRCAQPMKRKGPQGWVTEECGKRNVKELPDGTQVCVGCFNREQRRINAQEAADEADRVLRDQVAKLRSLGIEAAIQSGGTKAGVTLPTGMIIVSPSQLLSVLDRMGKPSVPKTRKLRAEVSA